MVTVHHAARLLGAWPEHRRPRPSAQQRGQRDGPRVRALAGQSPRHSAGALPRALGRQEVTMTAMLGLVLLGLGQPQGVPGMVVLGVLEQPQCKVDPAIAVRAMFVKQGRDWVAITSQAASQGVALPEAWTVGLDGRSLGGVTTFDPGFQTEYSWTFPRDRLLLLKPGRSVPNVANTEKKFSGWCDAPSRRPLIVVSRPAVRDPNRWKRYQPADALRARLFESFKAHAGPATTCPADSETPKNLLSKHGEPWLRDAIASSAASPWSRLESSTASRSAGLDDSRGLDCVPEERAR